MRNTLILILWIGSFLLAGCGRAAAAKTAGDAEAGKAIFTQTAIGQAPGCATCHAVEPDTVIVGPSLAGIAGRAGQRIPDKTAEAYLRESILTPNAYTVEGFPEGVMYQKFADVLTEDEIDNLVAYLLTLE